MRTMEFMKGAERAERAGHVVQPCVVLQRWCSAHDGGGVGGVGHLRDEADNLSHKRVSEPWLWIASSIGQSIFRNNAFRYVDLYISV